MLREIPLARHTWELLKPIQSNADPVNVERHLPSQFQLAPPKSEPGMAVHSGYHNPPNTTAGERSLSIEPPPRQSQPAYTSPSSTQYPMSPQSVGSPIQSSLQNPTEYHPSQSPISADGKFQSLAQKTDEYRRLRSSSGEQPVSPDIVSPTLPNASRIRPSATVKPTASVKSTSVSTGRSVKGSFWAGFSSPKKESSTDTTSLSSGSDAQKTEEIHLDGLKSMLKTSVRGKSSKVINVCLSQNSTHALFWTRPAIHIWDVGTTPPTAERMVQTNSTCVLAAVTKTYLAYVIGGRGQRLTVRYIGVLMIFACFG
jgi:hypothetical protein